MILEPIIRHSKATRTKLYTVKCLKDVATYLLHIGHLQLKQLGVVLVPGSSNEVNRKGFDFLAEET